MGTDRAARELLIAGTTEYTHSFSHLSLSLCCRCLKRCPSQPGEPRSAGKASECRVECRVAVCRCRLLYMPVPFLLKPHSISFDVSRTNHDPDQIQACHTRAQVQPCMGHTTPHSRNHSMPQHHKN